VPSLDLRDEKDRYVVTMDMPGADKGSLKIEVKGRYLSVSGRRDSTNETKQGGTVIQNERSTA
jgi:HSP20 family molecular chaperone IbpA